MSVYDHAVKHPRKMLTNVLTWLDKAEAYAADKGFDADVFVECRLAPDMYPLRRQVQAAADTAKFLACRLSGLTPPSHPDTETTLGELRIRVQSVLSMLHEIDPESLSTEGHQRLPWLPEGKAMTSEDYLVHVGGPNFMFHVTTIYAILRNNGVAVGKHDYIGHVDLIDV